MAEYYVIIFPPEIFLQKRILYRFGLENRMKKYSGKYFLINNNFTMKGKINILDRTDRVKIKN